MNFQTTFSDNFETQKNQWVYMEKVVLVPPEIKKLNVRIDADGYGQRGGTAWFDDLKIEKLDMSQNEIVSETNYYPFGLAHKGYNQNKGSTNLGENWKYNQGTSGTNFQGKEGKSFKVERQLELGLNLDMTKFRMYDYTTGRFTSIDPLADANPQESWTPYQYAYNSPIQYNDPYGDCPKCWDFIKNAWNSTSINSVSVSLGAGVKISNTGATASVAEFKYNVKTDTFSFSAVEAFAGVGDSQDAVKGEINVAYSSKDLDTKKGEGGFIKAEGVKIDGGDTKGGSIAIFAKNKDGKKGAVLTENINKKDDGVTEVSPPEADNKLKFGLGISFSFNSDKFNKLQDESKKQRAEEEKRK